MKHVFTEAIRDGLWFWPLLILEVLDALRVPGAERLLMRAERRAGL